MSNNALAAYSGGLRPISKWTKKDLINQVLGYENCVFSRADLESCSLQALKHYLLQYEEWVGTRNNGAYMEKCSLAIIKGKWAYTLAGKKHTIARLCRLHICCVTCAALELRSLFLKILPRHT